MIRQGNLLRFDPFIFENGNEPKPKYFIVLSELEDDVLIVSLPTKRDQIPFDVPKSHGCIEVPERCFNCYYFPLGNVVCENGFEFPKETYLYGEQAMKVSKQRIVNVHEASDIELCGKLNESEFNAIVECFKRSLSVRRAIRRVL